MKSEKLVTALILMLPTTLWAVAGGGNTVAVPEPSILPLLAAGGVVGLAVKFMRRKK